VKKVAVRRPFSRAKLTFELAIYCASRANSGRQSGLYALPSHSF
jgi:hypothetical protein